jgi:ABC-type multidrug transport system fused ATPase/permease subunit
MSRDDAPGPAATEGLAALGTGAQSDRMSFRLVLHILLRTLPLLAQVKRHLLALVALLLAAALAAVPIGYLWFTGLWDGILAGAPLPPFAARAFVLDPADFERERLLVARGIDADLVYRLARRAGLDPDALRVPVRGNLDARRRELGERLAAALASEPPERRPARVEWSRAGAEWVPRIEPQLDPAARRALRLHWVIGNLLVLGLYTPLIVAIIYYRIWILQRINQLLRVRLFERIQSLSLRYHADARVGDSIYRMYQDSAMVTNVIDVLFLQPAENAARFALGIAAVAAFDPRLALVLLAALPPLLALGRVFSGRLRVRFRSAREASSDLTSRIQETLAGIKAIKANGAERAEQQRFAQESLRAFERAYEARDLFTRYDILVFCATASGLLLAIVGGALLAGQQADVFLAGALAALGVSTWTLGGYNGFRAAAGQGALGAERFASLWGQAQDVAIGLDRVFELLDLEPGVADAPDAVELPERIEEIRFADVSFAYQKDRPVLHGVSLAARAGTITAIAGPTGSGKSTLVLLLLRLFDPDAGSIAIDGRDLRRLRIASLRARVSIALQENVLFGTTVRENIRYAAPDASDARVREAARVACAAEFIEALPDGYDTLLGERGTKLSTGQRQRITLARAILKDAPVLILDEPTAALDADTELRVMQNLAAWGRGRIIFLITHRLAAIRRADAIAVVRAGQLAELGSHDALMQREDGVYRRLVEIEARRAPLDTGA